MASFPPWLYWGQGNAVNNQKFFSSHLYLIFSGELVLVSHKSAVGWTGENRLWGDQMERPLEAEFQIQVDNCQYTLSVGQFANMY